MKTEEVWDYSKLPPLGKMTWDAMSRAVEAGDLYVLAKFFLGKDLFEPRVHQPLGRFIMAPLLGKYSTDGMLHKSDYDESEPAIPRGTMRGGDPLGAPFYYTTRMSNPPSRRQLLLLPRASFKSTYMEALVIMALLRDNNASVLIMGNDEDKAKDISNAVEQHITSNPKLIHYWHTDTWKSLARERGLTWTIEKKVIGVRSVTRQDASIIVSSLGALKPGKHVDLAILDDLINERTIASDVDSANVDKTVDLIEHMLDEKSVEYIIGTRWGKLDLYESLETHQTTGGKYRYDVYGRDDVLPSGRLWFPEQHSEEMLLDKWESALRVGQPWIFWSQRRMQPISETDKGLALDKIDWYTNKPPSPLNVAVVIDPADEDARGSGAWAIWALGVDSDRGFWDIDLTKARIKGENAMDEAMRMVKAYNAKVVIIENTVIARRFISAFEERLVTENLGSVPVIKVEHHGVNKAARIMSVENSLGAVMAQGRVHFRESNHIIRVELRTFPGGHYTYDALDAGSYMTAWCSDPRNHFFPRRKSEAVAEKPMTLDERILSNYHTSCDDALKRRDQLNRQPEFRWTRPGVREAVTR